MFSNVVFAFLFSLVSVDAAPNVYDQSQNGELNIQVDLKDLQIFALLNRQHEEYYEDIDYAYDYSEMTIKPQMSTTKKPLNTTTVGTTTANVTVATNVIQNITEPPNNNTQEIETTTTLVYDDYTTTVRSDTTILLNSITANSNTSGLQSRKEDEITSTSKNNMEAIEPMEETTKNTNASDSVTRKPQSVMSNISSIKSEIETTTKSINTNGSNVNTKLTTHNSNCKKGFIQNQRGGCDLKIQSMSNALLKIVKLSQKLKSRRHRNGQDIL